MSEVLICPVCGKPLKKTEKSFICEKGHFFDIAKEGYVNGVQVKYSTDGDCSISFCNPRITLRGLEYLQENSLMKKAAQLAKGIAEIL